MCANSADNTPSKMISTTVPGASESTVDGATPTAPAALSACEICGDEGDADGLEECESCSWKMCSSCNFDHGLCRDCAEEQGLLDD